MHAKPDLREEFEPNDHFLRLGDLCRYLLMIPIGYNVKRIAAPEPWLGNPDVSEILSISECLSESPIDHTTHWLCNDWLLYDNFSVLQSALEKSECNIQGLRYFFYEAHDKMLFNGHWTEIHRVRGNIEPCDETFEFRGYDITCFSCGDAPECSPLSCNSGASTFPVNRHCLLNTIESAIKVAEKIESNGGYEPGPYGIISVTEKRR